MVPANGQHLSVEAAGELLKIIRKEFTDMVNLFTSVHRVSNSLSVSFG